MGGRQMRPLKLRLSAFGPYINEIVLDLASLGKSGIYLITGDTGAGKTTIFDGIVYALYGKPSGANRDEGMLRSKGASPSVPTEVELDFYCKGKEYKIIRSPSYTRPKKSGEGFTNESAKVELHLPSGRVITKNDEVKAEIEGIIGLTRDQFLQIAMIAQGEFLKLLFASTEDRIKIFQKIFKTKPYEQLQNALGDKAKELGAEREMAHQSIRQYIAGIQIKEFSEFESELKRAKSDEMPIIDVIALIEKLIELDTREKKIIDTELKAIDDQIVIANNNLKTIEDNKKNKKELEKNQVALADLTPKLDDAKKEYDKQRSKEQRELRNETSTKIALIDSELKKYDELEEVNKDIAQKNAQLSKAQNSINTVNEQINKLTKEIFELEAEQKALKGAPEECARLEAKRNELLEKKKKLLSLKNMLDSRSKEAQKLEKSQQEYLKLRTFSDEAQSIYQEKQVAFLNEQAGILANELQDGKPCLVCGSIHHPSPAKKSTQAPSKEELEQYDNQRQDAIKKAQDASVNCATINGKLKELTNNLLTELCEFFGTEILLNDAEKAIQGAEGALTTEFEAISNQLDESNSKAKRLKTLEDIIPQRKQELDNARVSQSNCQNQLASLSASIEALEKHKKQIQGELKYESKQEILDAKETLITEQNEQNQALEDAEKTYNSLNEQFVALSTSIAELKAQLQNVRELNEESENEALKDLTTKKATLSRQSQEVASRISQNRYSHTEILKKVDEVSNLDEKYAWVKALSDTANGTVSGKEKIKLETYIQMTYFDRIIRRANIRLLKMTSGQYELKRKTDENSKRAQSGLDLDVINHFDSTQRSVKTLSGGESFKASLSLALGLAEEIQSSAGGVQIDTMFLDEGFGSLDEDSLDKAMSALASLGDGNRLVGIISHVSELKTRIEKQIVIKKDRSGGSTATIIT